MIFDLFDGTTLDGQWATIHANGGSHAVSGGALTLTVPNVSGAQAGVRQAAVVTLADGQAFTVRIGAAWIPFRTNLVIQQGADAAFYPAISLFGSTAAVSTYNVATRTFSLQSGTFAFAAGSWFRLRRAGATIVAESAPDASGLPGPWTPRHTLNDGDGGWTAAHNASRAVLVASDDTGTGGTFEVLQVGVPAGGGGSNPAARILPFFF